MDVSVIIVNYNTKDFLDSCLTSLFERTDGILYEVIVSDNGSTDGSIEMIQKKFPRVILIENKKNIGFGAANNRALAIAKGKYVFYLNSDTVLLNNAVKIFYEYFESYGDEKLGAIGCNLTDTVGNYIHSYGTFTYFKRHLEEVITLHIVNAVLSVAWLCRTSVHHKETYSAHYIGDVDFITGADLFIKNNDFARFDEDFFLYFEDSSLQLRMKKNNLRRTIIAGPEIMHVCGGSVGSAFTIFRKASASRIAFEFSRIRFLKKTFGTKSLLSRILLTVIKICIIASWCNPLLLPKTARAIKKIMKE